MSDYFKTDQWNCLDNKNIFNAAVSISSPSPSINKLFFPFFKGIPIKNITEIVGLPGSGKTCFAIQLAINALLQNTNNAVIYIDTSCNFTLERFNQIFRAQRDIQNVPISDFLDRMLVLPVVDLYDLFMQLSRLECLLKDLSSSSQLIPNLLIIDNIAAPFKLIPRVSFEKRSKIIDKLIGDLRQISSKYHCAILTVNQLTRKIILNPDMVGKDDNTNTPRYQLIPMLGQIWRNNVDSSIFLSGDCEKGRYAELSKSNILFEPLIDSESLLRAKSKIYYIIEEDGFIEENVK